MPDKKPRIRRAPGQGGGAWVKYVGPFAAVTITVNGVHAPRGVPVEVDPAVAESLLEQDTWASARAPKTADTEQPEEGEAE